MLDRWLNQKIKPVLNIIIIPLVRRKISPDSISIFGFIIGFFAVGFIIYSKFAFAIIFIVLNRILDGVDGCLARKIGITNRGGFLDIVLDFLFYSSIPLAFLINNPVVNGLSAGILIFSFIGTSTSFLAFAIVAEKLQIKNKQSHYKAIYYLEGLIEGSETLFFLLLFCVFPNYFSIIALCFACLCLITTIVRIFNGYFKIKALES